MGCRVRRIHYDEATQRLELGLVGIGRTHMLRLRKSIDGNDLPLSQEELLKMLGGVRSLANRAGVGHDIPSSIQTLLWHAYPGCTHVSIPVGEWEASDSEWPNAKTPRQWSWLQLFDQNGQSTRRLGQ